MKVVNYFCFRGEKLKKKKLKSASKFLSTFVDGYLAGSVKLSDFETLGYSPPYGSSPDFLSYDGIFTPPPPPAPQKKNPTDQQITIGQMR